MINAAYKTLVWVTAIASVVILVAIFFFRADHKELPDGGFPSLGNPQASVRMVLFEDMKCSQCKTFMEYVLPELQKEYISTGKVRLTLVPISIISGSDLPARAVLCVEAQDPSRVFPFLETMFREGDAEKGWTSFPHLLESATMAGGIDIPGMRSCLMNKMYSEVLERNLVLAKRWMKKVRTPSVFINGTKVHPPTLKKIQSAVEEARKKG